MTADRPSRKLSIGTWLLACILGCWIVAPSDAAFETTYVVTQPIWNHEEEVILCEIPYLLYEYGPGIELEYTCAANVVYTALGAEDRNVAHRMGIRLRIVQRPQYKSGAWAGDSLRVVLNVAALDTVHGPNGITPDLAFETTLEAIRTNASRCVPAVHYLEIVIEGSDRYQTWARVYPVDPMPRRTAHRAAGRVR